MFSRISALGLRRIELTLKVTITIFISSSQIKRQGPITVLHTTQFNSLHPDISMYFLLQFYINFLRHQQGEFVGQSRVPLAGDHFPDSCDLNF